MSLIREPFVIEITAAGFIAITPPACNCIKTIGLRTTDYSSFIYSKHSDGSNPVTIAASASFAQVVFENVTLDGTPVMYVKGGSTVDFIVQILN